MFDGRINGLDYHCLTLQIPEAIPVRVVEWGRVNVVDYRPLPPAELHVLLDLVGHDGQCHQGCHEDHHQEGGRQTAGVGHDVSQQQLALANLISSSHYYLWDSVIISLFFYCLKLKHVSTRNDDIFLLSNGNRRTNLSPHHLTRCWNLVKDHLRILTSTLLIIEIEISELHCDNFGSAGSC